MIFRWLLVLVPMLMLELVLGLGLGRLLNLLSNEVHKS
jgi:hypothetical protein